MREVYIIKVSGKPTVFTFAIINIDKGSTWLPTMKVNCVNAAFQIGQNIVLVLS